MNSFAYNQPWNAFHSRKRVGLVIAENCRVHVEGQRVRVNRTFSSISTRLMPHGPKHRHVLSVYLQMPEAQIHTPPKINIEPENDGLESWKMIFLFQGCILRFHVNLHKRHTVTSIYHTFSIWLLHLSRMMAKSLHPWGGRQRDEPKGWGPNRGPLW